MYFKRKYGKPGSVTVKKRNSKTSVPPNVPLLSISLAFAIHAKLFAMTNIYNGSTFHILSLLRDLSWGKKKEKRKPHTLHKINTQGAKQKAHA